jgi:hypothetical protein
MPICARLEAVDSRAQMPETLDELSAPLGQNTAARKRRSRLPFTAMQAFAFVLGLSLLCWCYRLQQAFPP